MIAGPGRRKARPRRDYTDEFKRKVASEYLAGESFVVVGQRHSVSPTNVWNWVQRLRDEEANKPPQLDLELPPQSPPPLALPAPSAPAPWVRLIGSMGQDGAEASAIMFQFHLRTPVVVAHDLWRVHTSLPNTRADLAAWSEGDWPRSEPVYLSPLVWRLESMFDEPLPQEIGNQCQWDLEVLYDHCRQVHRDLVEIGVCPHLSGLALPMGTETTWIWTLSLNAAAVVVREGLAPGARSGLRIVAQEIERQILQLYPLSSRHVLAPSLSHAGS